MQNSRKKRKEIVHPHSINNWSIFKGFLASTMWILVLTMMPSYKYCAIIVQFSSNKHLYFFIFISKELVIKTL